MDDLVSNSNSKKGGSGSKLQKGLWSPEEDEKLMNYMLRNGQGCWSDIARNAELQRCGKSCRLRWINYLRPDLKRGAFSSQEEDLILRLHSILGNRWSQIAARLPGRTDNEIKNFWNSTTIKRMQNKNSHKSIPTSPDGRVSSFDPADTFSGGTSSTREKYDLMKMCTELLPFNSSVSLTKRSLTPFHFPFDPYSQSDYCYTDYNGACADSLFNMEPIYFDQIDLGTDNFNVDQGIIDEKLATNEDIRDDPWNMDFKQDGEEKFKVCESSVIYTNRSPVKNGINGTEEDTMYGNAEEHWPDESLKMGEMWDMEGLVDYASCSSNSFPCENLPQTQ